MAKATDTITLTAVRDIQSVTWYYQLKAGTSAPAKPTASPPPSPWTDTEPSYTAGDTKYLFIVERTVYTDGTFDYTAPTMSSSYEAAKLAYTEAQNAKKTATNFLTESTSTGLMVHRSTDSTTGWKIADALELLKSGVSFLKAYVENSIAKIRIGRADQGNVLIDNDSVDIRNGSTLLASFGSRSASIGADSEDAVIDLCSGRGVIAVSPDYGIGLQSEDSVCMMSTQESQTTEEYRDTRVYMESYNDGIETTYASISAVARDEDLGSQDGTITFSEDYPSGNDEGLISIAQARVEGDTFANAEISASTSGGDPYISLTAMKYGTSPSSNALMVEPGGVSTDKSVDSGGYKVNGNTYIVSASFSKDNFSIAKSSYATTTIDVAKDGYTILGIMGYNFTNASSSGQNASMCHSYGISWSGTTVTVKVRNHATTAAKIKVTIRVLYRAA